MKRAGAAGLHAGGRACSDLVRGNRGGIGGGKVLHLLRHAESTWNEATAGEHVGAHPGLVLLDAPLSARGRLQAAAIHGHAARLVPPPELVLSSPLSRALSTALAFNGSGGSGGAVPLELEPLCREQLENSCDIGRSTADLAVDAEFAALFTGGGSDTCWWGPLPGAGGDASTEATLARLRAGEMEPNAAVALRCAALLVQIARRPETSIVVVSHCMFLRALEEALGYPAREYLANAQVKTVHAPSAVLARFADIDERLDW